MMLNSKSIGNKIVVARKKINLSQADLAQQIPISSQAVGKWERGESMPDIATLNRLAEILGVDLNYFSENFPSIDTGMAALTSLDEQPVELQASVQKKKPSLDMSQGNWVNADFTGIKNLQEKFSSSNMKHCKFVGSDMSGLLLKSNNVENCDFSGSDISSSKIQTSNLSHNQFKDCLLKEAEFSESDIKSCDFSGADFTGVVFKTVNLESNTVADAVFNATSFKRTHIADIVFEGTMEDCSFDNCSFSKVTFQNSRLINTFFKCRNLKRIQFMDCQADRITYEFLKNGKADVSGITLLP